jgi:hypothetical protein
VIDFLLYLLTPTLVYELNFPRRSSFRPLYFLGHSTMILSNIVSIPNSNIDYSSESKVLTPFLVYPVRSANRGYTPSGQIKSFGAYLWTILEAINAFDPYHYPHDLFAIRVTAKCCIWADSVRRQRVLLRLVECSQHWGVLWKMDEVHLSIFLQARLHATPHKIQNGP